MDIEIKGRTGDLRNLLLCKSFVIDIFKILKKYFKVKMPDKLTIMSLNHKRKNIKQLTIARAGYSSVSGWYISIRCSCICHKPDDMTLDVLCHEVAHIGEALLTERWSHSKRWNSIYQTLHQELLRIFNMAKTD